MIKSGNLKKLIPHVVAILIFVIVAVIYFYPQVNGYRLKQHDIQQYIGMSNEISNFRAKFHEEPLWTNSAFSGMPAYQISTKNSNAVNSLANFISKILPGTLGQLFFLMIGFYILLMCFNISPWLAIIGSVAFGLSSFDILYLVAGHNAKVHALSFIAPLIGSIIYAYRKNYLMGSALLSVFVCLQLSANHVQMTYYMLFMLAAIIIVEFYLYLQNKELRKFFKVSALLLVAGILGVLPTISNLMVTNEYGKYTTRGKSELTISPDNNRDDNNNNALESSYIKQHSLGKGEIWSLVFPNVKGGAMGFIGQDKEIMKEVNPAYKNMIAQQSSYWGEQYVSGGAFYYGATVFLLFVLGMFFVKDKIKWAFFAVSVLAVLLSLKYSKITDFFIQYFPLFNKFRDTKMMLVLVQISFPLLGMLFVNNLLKNGIEKKKFIYVSLSVSGIFLLFYIMPSVWFGFFSRDETRQFSNLLTNYSNNHNALVQIEELKKEIIHARIGIFKKDCLRSLFFIVATAVLIYLFLIKKLKETSFLIILGCLILIDLWGVDKRYLNNDKKGRQYKQWENADKYRNPYPATVADKAILNAETEADNSLRQTINTLQVQPGKNQQFQHEKLMFRELDFATDYRVFTLDNPFSSARTSYFHKSIGGYHGAKLKKYQELIDFYLFPEYTEIVNVLKNKPTFSKIDSLLKEDIPVLNMLNTKYIIYNTSAQPIINSYNYGNAWFVKSIKMVKDADEEMLSLKHIDKNTAIVKDQYKNQIPTGMDYDPSAKIELVSYRPNHLIYKTTSICDQVAVFSEIYYPAGWNAYIDGKKADYFEANYVLRAMLVPKGKHTVEFKFEPATYYLGRKISHAGSGLIFIFVIGMIFLEMRHSNRIPILRKD